MSDVVPTWDNTAAVESAQPADVHGFMDKIAQVESSGGKNFNHAQVTRGPQKGHTAIGTYGLMPNTVDEVVKSSGDESLHSLLGMSPSEKKTFLESNPEVEKKVATHLATKVLSNQGGDEEKAAYAWNHGHNLSSDTIKARGYENDAYTKSFQKARAPASVPTFDSTTPVSAQAPPTWDQTYDPEEKYGGAGQQAIAGVEGAASGVLGPLAPMAEKAFGVPEEDIRGRAEVNPITHGVGQGVGLVGSTLGGMGLGSVMGAAGKGAAALTGLGELAPTASLGFKVGQAAVTQAAEMAVLQGSDEASKMILNDPDASAQSAMANIGLAGALGGAGGAFMSGVVSPLWKATAGPHVEELLSGLTNHLNGTSSVLPEAVQAAEKTLGVEVPPVMRTGMSGSSPTATEWFNTLRETQNPEVLKSIEELHKNASNSVAKSLGVSAEDAAHYSDNEAGHELLDTFKKEYNEKYEPLAKQMKERDEVASTIAVPDTASRDQYGRMIEKGMNAVGTDSPYYKLYEDYGQRVMAQGTIGKLDKLTSEIGNRARSITTDLNEKNALRDIGEQIQAFKEAQIARQARGLEKAGVGGAKQVGADLLNQRAEANRNYAEFAGMSRDLLDHLGMGKFSGAGGLEKKLTDSVSAEQLLKRFSPRGNVDSIPFLEQHFPETLAKVKNNETKQLIKPALLSAKGENEIDVKKLNSIIDKHLAGQPEYLKFAVPQEAIDKAKAAETLLGAIPAFKSSGTAGWQTKVFKHIPASAMAAVAGLTGHSPGYGFLAGEIAQRLGKDAPEAIKLGLLKFVGSDQPIKAEGFKAMVEFMHNSIKGQNMLAKATSAVLKGGTQVLTTSQIPNSSDREKLDKTIVKMQDNPDKMIQMLQGDTGHYLPNHQQALATAATQSIQYLQALKPHPQQLSPLDRPIEPTPAQEARYNRALDIAINPAVVMQHVKDGTLQPTDLMDLHNLYPSLYQTMSAQLTAKMSHGISEEDPIPYHTRIGISLFLGQPLDSSMTPGSIMAAQPKPQMPPPQGPQGGKKPSKSTNSLNKNAKSYQTPGQAAESDRSSRD